MGEAILEGRGHKELTSDNLSGARVRLIKDPIIRKDGIPSFKFMLHPSHKLPQLNVKNKTFRSRDLRALFEVTNKASTKHDVSPSIVRLLIRIEEDAIKLLHLNVLTHSKS
jgi:hypothetical protein